MDKPAVVTLHRNARQSRVAPRERTRTHCRHFRMASSSIRTVHALRRQAVAPLDEERRHPAASVDHRRSQNRGGQSTPRDVPVHARTRPLRYPDLAGPAPWTSTNRARRYRSSCNCSAAAKHEHQRVLRVRDPRHDAQSSMRPTPALTSMAAQRATTDNYTPNNPER